MKRKLDDEEYQALLNMFGKDDLKIRSVSVQSNAFKYAFYFINIFAIFVIIIFLYISSIYGPSINSQNLDTAYLEVFDRRAFVFFWLLSAFNLSFYFGLGFRFVATVALIYLLNASIDRFLVMYYSDFFAYTQGLLVLAASRPLAIIALLIVIIKYVDE